jgi:hypothetical protein
MSQSSYTIDGCPNLQLMDVPIFTPIFIQLMDVPIFTIDGCPNLHQYSERPELPDIFRYSTYIGGLEVNVVSAIDSFDAKVGVI